MNFWDNWWQPLIKIAYYVFNRILSRFERLITFSKIVAPYEIGYFNKIVPLLFCYFYLRVLLFNSFIENIFLLSHFFVSICLCKILHQLSKVLHNLSKVLHKSYGKHYSISFTLPSHIYLQQTYNKPCICFLYNLYCIFYPKNCIRIFCINSFIFLYICFLYNLYSVKFTEKLQFLKMYKYTKKMHKYTFFKFR